MELRPSLPVLAALGLLASACAHGERGPVGRLVPEGETLLLPTLAGGAEDLGAIAASHDATILVWWSSRCPCVRRYQERMEALADAFPAQRVAVRAIASNADDDLARVRQVSGERSFTLPLLIDPDGALARRLGVRSTPTTLVLDRQGRVRFLGWIDNEREPGEPGRIPYVEQAVQALLAPGAEAPATRSPTYGCRITRRLGEPMRCVEAPAASTPCPGMAPPSG